MFGSKRKQRTQRQGKALAGAFTAQRAPHADSHPRDTLLPEGAEPEIGAHILSHRRRYSHHGIYVGAGRVLHYAGFAHGLSCGPIEEVSLREFAQHRPIWLRSPSRETFPPEEVVRRARLRMGENRYQVLRNNCEHFCEWALHGEPRSFQVECLSLFSRALVATVAAIAALVQPALPAAVGGGALSRDACA